MRKIFSRTLTTGTLLATLVFLVFELITIPQSYAQGTKLKVAAPTNIALYADFIVDINVTDVAELYAWQIKLYYNPTILRWINATYPAGHVFEGKSFIQVEPTNDSDSEGTFILFFATLTGQEPTFTGSGILCRISFKAQSEGTSMLNFSRPLGADGDTWLSKDDLLFNIPFTVVESLATVVESAPDLIPPTVQITYPLNGSEVRASTITLTWSGYDESSGINYYEIRLNSGLWIDVGMNTNHTAEGLSDGSHTFEVRAIDNAGNTNQTSISFAVNTSPLFGPGYIEEAAIVATAIIAVLIIAVYLKKAKKH